MLQVSCWMAYKSNIGKQGSTRHEISPQKPYGFGHRLNSQTPDTCWFLGGEKPLGQFFTAVWKPNIGCSYCTSSFIWCITVVVPVCMNTKNTWNREQWVPTPGPKLLLLACSQPGIRSFGSQVLPCGYIPCGATSAGLLILPFCDRVSMLINSVQKRSSDFGIRDKMTVLIWTMLLHCVMTRCEAWELRSADSFSSFLEVSCPLGQSWHMNSTSRYNWCHIKPGLAGPRGK